MSEKYLGNVAEVASLNDVTSIFVKNQNQCIRQIPTETLKEGIYESLPIDSELSESSTNSVQNKVIHNALKDKADVIITSATGTTVTTTDSAKAKPKNIRLYGKTEQDSTEGNQLFNISVIETTSYSGAVTNITEVGNDYIVVNSTDDYNGNGYVNSLKKLSQICPRLETGKTYIISGQTQSKNKFINVGVTWEFGKTQTITQEMLDSYVLFYGNDVLNGGQSVGTCKIWDIQIQEGTVATDCEKYTDGEATPNMNYKQPLNSYGASGSIVGKVLSGNVFNSSYRNKSNRIWSGSCTVEENQGVFNIVATKTDMYVWNITVDGVIHSENETACELMTIPNNVSEISVVLSNKEINANYITFFDEHKVSIGNRRHTSNVFTQAVIEGAKYFTIRFGKGDAVVGTTYETTVMVNYGKPKEYEPYTEQPFTVLTPNGLLGLPVSIGGNHVDSDGQKRMVNIKDYGIGKNIERIYRLRMSAALAWTYHETTNNKNHNFKLHLTNNGFPRGIQWTTVESYAYLMATKFTHFRVVDVVWDNTGFGESKAYVSDTTLVTSFSADSEINSLEAFKQFLDDNEVYVEYIVAEPIITDLTQEELDQYNALLMNYPNTTVVNDAGAYMEVEYTADVKNYIANIEKKHEEDIQTLKNAILSLGGNI